MVTDCRPQGPDLLRHCPDLRADPGPGVGTGELGFWAELARTRAELESLPPASASTVPSTTVAVVGSLRAAVPVVRRLQRDLGPGPVPVVVLSPRAELVCEAGWTLVRSGARLAEATHRPERTVLVIDADPPLPRWVGPLVARLRRAGLGLVHHALEEAPDDGELTVAAKVLGQPLALDLASPMEPARLVDLVSCGHRLASVRGVPLSAEVVVAARTSCGRR
jgi:hypothetical protein